MTEPGIAFISAGSTVFATNLLVQMNINVQGLTVGALLTGKREYIYHAAMLDPHTSVELDLGQSWALTDAFLRGYGNFIPESLRVVR